MRRRDCLRWVGCGLSFSVVARALPGVRPLALEALLDASIGACSAVPRRVNTRSVDVFGARRLVTEWRLEDVRPLVYELPPSFTVTTLGGESDDVQQWVPHEARFVEGEAHVVFLMPGALSTLWVTGMQQGAYHLESGSNGQSVVLTALQRELARDPRSACARLQGREPGEVALLLTSIVRS